jgi:hypothetical protein
MATSGGEFPAEMKYAGFDMIVISGEAKELTRVSPQDSITLSHHSNLPKDPSGFSDKVVSHETHIRSDGVCVFSPDPGGIFAAVSRLKHSIR